jgi:hypothetical protein
MTLLISLLTEQRALIHMVLHVLIPLLVAGVLARGQVKYVFIILMSTMLVDLDHLLAVPVYVANRCSIWFHPLHTLVPIIAYILMMLWPLLAKGKRHSLVGWIGAGLVIHMSLDALDCWWMSCSIGL